MRSRIIVECIISISSAMRCVSIIRQAEIIPLLSDYSYSIDLAVVEMQYFVNSSDARQEFDDKITAYK